MIFLENKLSPLFPGGLTPVKAEEGFRSFTVSFEGRDFAVPSEKILQELYAEINDNDRFEFIFTLGDSNPLNFQSTVDKIPDIVRNLQAQTAFYEKGKPVKIELRINKNLANPDISVYHLPAFSETLEQLSIV